MCAEHDAPIIKVEAADVSVSEPVGTKHDFVEQVLAERFVAMIPQVLATRHAAAVTWFGARAIAMWVAGCLI